MQLQMTVSFVDFSPYYKDHIRKLHKKNEWENVNGDYTFEEDGSLCRKEDHAIMKKGFFPASFKKTEFYKKTSAYLYPKLFRGIKPSGSQADVLCAVLEKNK